MRTERHGHRSGIERLAHRSGNQDWFAIGCALEEDERFHEAVRAYRRALSSPEKSASVHFNLANCLYKLRRKIEAVEQYRLALRLDHQSHEVWNNLGVVLCELRECDDAALAFQQAIAFAPWSGDAFFNLADCLDERGARTEAYRYWHDYLRFDRSSEWADYARLRIKGA